VSTDLPLVSIITPAYNRASFLDETIQSVLAQDYPRIEYIVLDDGSTDNTREVLRKYNGRIVWESHPNMGETRTVNKGFSMATGEIVCVVNSDDPLLPGAVSTAVTVMQERPDVLAVYPDWNEIDCNSEVLKEVRLPDYDISNMLRDFNVAMGPGTFIRRKAFDLVKMRDAQLKYTGDLDFWFQLALHGRLAHIPKTLATHRTHPDSASVSDRGEKMAGELIRLVAKVYSHPDLPLEVERLRSKVFSRAHYVAAFYCGSNRSAAIRHWLWSIRYHPLGYIGPLLGRMRHRARSWLLRVMYVVLKSAWLLFQRRWPARQRFLSGGAYKGKALKFALVSHVLPPSWSGQAVMIGRLLRGVDPGRYCLISRQNYELNESQEDFIERLPGKYYHLPHELRIGGRLHSSLMMWADTLLGACLRGWNIARILRRECCAAVVVGTGDVIDLPAAYLASRLAGVAFFPHLFDDYTYQWPDEMTQTMARRIESVIFKEVEGVIVPNEFLRDEMHRRYGVSPSIVHNPCETVDTDWEGKHVGSDRDETRIVYMGAIYRVNFAALRNLILALEHLGRPDVKLHLYTAQPRGFLAGERICGGHVVFHPHLPPSQVVEVQQSASILFLPFAFDASVSKIVKTSAPGKFGEYLASGRPILAHVPPDSFVSWYLRKYECGLVVDKDDPLMLAQAIRGLIDDKGLQDSLSRNARTRASADFSPVESQKRFLGTLEQSREHLVYYGI
jgi:glycosyltransferase involved in cell wall biosynthesis